MTVDQCPYGDRKQFQALHIRAGRAERRVRREDAKEGDCEPRFRPNATAHKLLENFDAVVSSVKRSHPWVARTIALSACRGADPLTMARSYMKNYDAIVQMASRIHPHRAREVATQAFRSDNPLRWAKRYLSELQKMR